MADPSSVGGLVLTNNGNYTIAPDQRRYHAAENSAAGGITNARALARGQALIAVYHCLCYRTRDPERWIR